jgi:SAM-dependent methyltransferase
MIDGYAAIADIYDYVGLYRDRPDVQFFVDAAARAGSPILELGCGTGRVLIPTARAGLTIVGVDGSPDMLRVCRQRLDAEPPAVRDRVRLVDADMRDFDLGGQRFTLVTIPFRPFQHLLTVDDQLACLACIRRQLVEDGTLILDLFNPSLELLVHRTAGELSGDEPEFATPDGRHIVRRHRMVAHDRFNQVLDGELVYDVTHPDGTREEIVHAFRTRYLFRFEAEHLLVRAGFRLDELYAGYDRSRYGSTYPGELVMVAKKAVG